MQGLLNRCGGGSDAIVVENSCKWFNDTFDTFSKAAKPFWESGVSVPLKKIPTNSSGDGMTSEVDFFFTMFDITADV